MSFLILPHLRRLRYAQQRRKERGQSMTEFALVLPILLLLIFGVIDFGRLLFLYVQVSNGAREAARYGSLVGLEHTSSWVRPQYVDCPSIRQAAIETFGLDAGIQPSDIVIQYDNGATLRSGLSCPVIGGFPDHRLILPGDRVRVTITTQFQFVTPVIRDFVPQIAVSFTAARTILKGGVLVVPGPF